VRFTAVATSVAISIVACGENLPLSKEIVDGGASAPPADGGDADVAAVVDAGADAEAGAVSSAAYVAAVLVDSPLVYLRLQNTLGDTAGQRNGTAIGSIDFDLGGFGEPRGGLRLRRDNGCVSLGASWDSLFKKGRGFTVEVWVRPTAHADAFMAILGRSGAGHPRRGLVIDKTNKVALANLAESKFDPQITSSIALPENRYTHIVLTASNESRGWLYQNGVVVVENTPIILEDDSAPNVTLGCFNTLFDQYDGLIDELAIYDGYLRPDRVAAHFAASGIAP